MDLLIHVIRCFENDNIVHVNGKIDPVSEKEVIDYELIIKDLDSVDRRIDKIKKEAVTGDKEKKIEYEISTKKNLAFLFKFFCFPVDKLSKIITS